MPGISILAGPRALQGTGVQATKLMECCTHMIGLPALKGFCIYMPQGERVIFLNGSGWSSGNKQGEKSEPGILLTSLAFGHCNAYLLSSEGFRNSYAALLQHKVRARQL